MPATEAAIANHPDAAAQATTRRSAPLHNQTRIATNAYASIDTGSSHARCGPYPHTRASPARLVQLNVAPASATTSNPTPLHRSQTGS